MSNEVNITKAAKLAGITRQTMSKKVSDGLLSKNSNGKIDISELLRVYPNIKIDDTSDTHKVLEINVTRQLEAKLSEQENKYLKQRIDDLESQLSEARADKADLSLILKQQTASLPNPNAKKHWWKYSLGLLLRQRASTSKTD